MGSDSVVGTTAAPHSRPFVISRLTMCMGWDSSAEDDLSLRCCCTSLSVLEMNAAVMLTAGSLVLLDVKFGSSILVIHSDKDHR